MERGETSFSTWPMFPIAAGGKTPLTKRGFKDATNNADQLARWDAEYPGCNWAVPTGAASGFFVVDVDPRHGGDKTLADLEARLGKLPETVLSWTGGGGKHYLFRHPGRTIPCSSGKIGPGIDIKGDGGYIVIPPSTHSSGGVYRWDIELHPERMDPLDAPQWLFDLISSNRPVAPAMAAEGKIPTGSRNQVLAGMAGAMRRKGMSADSILAGILKENMRCDPPLSEIEVARIAQSISRYDPSAPDTPAVPEQPKFVVVTAEELGTMDIPPRDYLLDPWLRAKDLAMIYAHRGIGKTWVSNGVALAVATGGAIFGWQATKARRVLLIDGEMQQEALKARLKILAESMDVWLPSNLTILGNDFQEVGGLPNLASPQGQKGIEYLLAGVEFLVIDNVSTLCRGGVENDAESWDIMQDWLLGLRRRGLTALLVHHAGKGGNQRGTSKREDVLDTSISLTHPDDYNPEQGARFVLKFEKARAMYGKSADSFEAQLTTGWDGRQTWTTQCLENARDTRILTLKRDGLTESEIAKEMGVHRTTINRALRKIQEGLPA